MFLKILCASQQTFSILQLLVKESKYFGKQEDQDINLTISDMKRAASQVALVVKSPSACAGDLRDVGLIPGSGRCPRGGHGYPLQCSCLKNPMDRGAWQATVHRFAKSQTQLKQLSMNTHVGDSESG